MKKINILLLRIYWFIGLGYPVFPQSFTAAIISVFYKAKLHAI